METEQGLVEGGRHGCGKCFLSFSSPEYLQKHQLSCFGDVRSNNETSTPSQASADDDDEDDEEEIMVNDNSNIEPFAVTIDEQDSVDMSDRSYSPVSYLMNSLSHPAFDPIMARNNEPGGRCIRIVGGKKIMQCTTCLKTFTNYNSFKRHRRMHVSGAAHRCNICGKNFYRRYLWRNHMERNHGDMMGSSIDKSNQERKDGTDSPLENSEFSDTESSKSPIKKYPCYLCEETFKSRMDLADHQHNQHSITQVAFPVYTDKKSSSEIVLDENANNQKNDFNIQDHWERAASDGIPELSSSKFDISSTTSSPGPLTDLKECIPSNSSLDMLRFDKRNSSLPVSASISDSDGSDSHEHISTSVEESRNEQPYSCGQCEISFKDEASLKHHKKKHLGQKMYICQFCCLSFYRSESLMTHLKKHDKINFICHFCKHEASNTRQLKDHFDSMHNVTSKPSIDVSVVEEDMEIGDIGNNIPVIQPEPVSGEQEKPSIVNSHNNLNGTTSNVSSKSDSLNCSVCSDKFNNKLNFINHMKVHAHLFCGFCGKQFPHEKELSRHRMGNECSNRRACHICAAPFISGEELKNHVIFHKQRSSIDRSNFSVDQLLHRKPMNEASKRVDNLLRNKGLLPSTTKETVTSLSNDFKTDYGTELSFTKSVVPSSGIHSAISVTLKPIDRVTQVTKNNNDKAAPSNAKAHICMHCGKNFVRQELLQRHMIRDHVFSKTSTSKVAPESNRSTAVKSISRKQNVVEAPPVEIIESPVKKKLVSPSTSHENNFPKTPIPPKLLPSPNETRNKVSLLEPKKKSHVFKCNYCIRSFISLASLNQHLVEHFFPYFCEFCGMPFAEKSEMVSHTNGVHGRAQRYYCYACCTNVNGSAELRYHIKECRGPPVPEEVATPTISSLLSQHSFGTYKECKTCHKKFANEKRLMNHTCIGGGGSEGLWVCDICNCSFPQSSHLASHQQQAHKCEELYRCDVCGLSSHKEFIVTHMITVHMTKVSSASNNSPSPGPQSSLTITPISQGHSKSLKPSTVNSYHYQNPQNNVHMNESMFLTPKNPNEVQITCNFKQSPVSTSQSGHNEVKIVPPSGHDFCIICQKMVVSSDFPEHMLRVHCAGVRILPTNNKESPLKSSETKDHTNVIEIITKEEPNLETSVQLVR